MIAHAPRLVCAAALALATSCNGASEDDPAGSAAPGGKADNVNGSELCPEDATLNTGSGASRRCFDPSNGQFVPTECCAEICAGAGIRVQTNGERCAWTGEPGLPGAVQGQFAPTLCCDLNADQACARAEGEPGDCTDPESGQGVDDVCCDATPQTCHPVVARAIDRCINAQADALVDEGEPIPNLLALFDTCTSELDTVSRNLAERCEFQPDLPFCSLDFEAVATEYIEPCATEGRDQYDCAFGSSFFSALAQTHLTLVKRDVFGLLEASNVAPLVQQQIVEAVSINNRMPVGLDEAFTLVDDGVVNHIEVFDLSSSRGYTIVEFGAGDNSFGSIFATGTVDAVAEITDGDISSPGGLTGGCDAPIGPGGNTCGSNEDCPAGYRCEGRVDDPNPIQTPLGLCIDQGVNTNNDECSDLRGCGDGQYCTGLAFGENGFCGAGWMFGERQSGASVSPADGASARGDVLVYGQASVPMDLEVTLDLFHDSDANEVRVELLIPGPSDGADEDRARVTVWPREGVSTDHPTGGRVTVSVNAFGDEGINGTWTIVVTDTAADGQSGGVSGWSLRYSSRFD